MDGHDGYVPEHEHMRRTDCPRAYDDFATRLRDVSEVCLARILRFHVHACCLYPSSAPLELDTMDDCVRADLQARFALLCQPGREECQEGRVTVIILVLNDVKNADMSSSSTLSISIMEM